MLSKTNWLQPTIREEPSMLFAAERKMYCVYWGFSAETCMNMYLRSFPDPTTQILHDKEQRYG
jgi:hypothetical protein